MKIDGSNSPKDYYGNIGAKSVTETDTKGKASNTKASEKIQTTDKVDISGKGKEIAELKAAASQLPEVRTDKVKEMKQSVESGNYKVNALKIAQKMLNEI